MIGKNTGKKRTKEQRTRISRTTKEAMKSLNKYEMKENGRRQGLANRGQYDIMTPTGEIIDIIGLTQFCKDNNLYVSNLVMASKNGKSYKGYRVLYDKGTRCSQVLGINTNKV